MGPDQNSTVNNAGSIAQRLAALQRSGECEWRKRISKRHDLEDVKRQNLVNNLLTDNLLEKPALDSAIIPSNVKGGNVQNCLGKLKSSTENWRSRIEPVDVPRLVVAGRVDIKSPSRPLFERANAKNSPRMNVLQSANPKPLGLERSSSMADSFSEYCLDKRELLEAENAGKVADNDLLDFVEQNSSIHRGHGAKTEESFAEIKKKSSISNLNHDAFAGAKRTVPKPNDEEIFSNFFSSMQNSIIDYSFKISSFDDIKSTERLSTKRCIRGPNGRRTTTHNHLKVLASRDDTHSAYTEVKVGVTEKHSKHVESKSTPTNYNFSEAALAGLASVENYKSVNLKSSLLPLNQSFLPYKPIMLLHIKGRTHVQTRLVEPIYTSINRGDCFILITENNLYRYVGSLANVIETSRSKQICAYIIENKDLGCTSSTEVVLYDRDTNDSRQWKEFWSLLQKPDDYEVPDCGHGDEDDLFEASLIETNMIYEFFDDSLVPIEKYWGAIPKIEMLDTKKVLVFDFGSEVYVWNGKNAHPRIKRAAISLVEELFLTRTADYGDCYLNPLNFSQIAGCRDVETQKSTERFHWCLLAKVTQNMETILFKEKFLDWPECQREDLEKDYLLNDGAAIRRLNGANLYKGEPFVEPNLVLEGSNLGRGNFYYDQSSMRRYDIKTKLVTVWKINDCSLVEQNESCYGHFYSTESYIVRWMYQISITVRELSGKVSSRSTDVGRDRCVYFCWQGMDASANEKGVAALLTVELDKEKGSQVRISEGEEFPAFLRLFSVIFQHKGSRDECWRRRSVWRMYIVIGNYQSEFILKEVICDSKSLRSRASVLLINGELGNVFIWHGCKSPPHTQSIAKYAAETINHHKFSDLFDEFIENIRIEEIYEGEENESFANAFIDGFNGSSYHSLVSLNKMFNYTPRLFHFSSSQGSFQANELLFSLRTKDLCSPFPFTQSTLYNARQPTIFMIDDDDKLWLWLGWWPKDVKFADETEDLTNENRSGLIRWMSERRAALETAVSYWQANYDYKQGVSESTLSCKLSSGDERDESKTNDLLTPVRGGVVWAGLEPIEFINLFPYWESRHDIKDINLQDGRSKTPISIVDYLSQLTQKEYPLAVLKRRPLPEGVEPTRLELYLRDSEFVSALGITRTEFDQLPLWKQTNLKKERGFF